MCIRLEQKLLSRDVEHLWIVRHVTDDERLPHRCPTIAHAAARYHEHQRCAVGYGLLYKLQLGKDAFLNNFELTLTARSVGISCCTKCAPKVEATGCREEDGLIHRGPRFSKCCVGNGFF